MHVFGKWESEKVRKWESEKVLKNNKSCKIDKT
jgi:hypothetical protein